MKRKVVVTAALALSGIGLAQAEGLATSTTATGGCRSAESLVALLEALVAKKNRAVRKLLKSGECTAIPVDQLAVVLEESRNLLVSVNGEMWQFWRVSVAEQGLTELYVAAVDWKKRPQEPPPAPSYVPPGPLEGRLVRFDRTLLMCRDADSLKESRMFKRNGDSGSFASLLGRKACAYFSKEDVPVPATVTWQIDDMIEVSIQGAKIWAWAQDVNFQ